MRTLILVLMLGGVAHAAPPRNVPHHGGQRTAIFSGGIDDRGDLMIGNDRLRFDQQGHPLSRTGGGGWLNQWTGERYNGGVSRDEPKRTLPKKRKADDDMLWNW